MWVANTRKSPLSPLSQTHWGGQCRGSRQSPIDIESQGRSSCAASLVMLCRSLQASLSPTSSPSPWRTTTRCQWAACWRTTDTLPSSPTPTSKSNWRELIVFNCTALFIRNDYKCDWLFLSSPPPQLSGLDCTNISLVFITSSGLTPHISGAGLTNNYKFGQVHFHWGEDSSRGRRSTNWCVTFSNICRLRAYYQWPAIPAGDAPGPFQCKFQGY